NGSMFSGYQMQSHGTRTVQGELEKAVSIVANEPIRLTCAGRTDTGVHATGQVVHFDTTVQRELKAWMLGANTNLPSDIAVHWVRQVSDDFSARFSAISRSYRYILFNRRIRSAVFQKNVAWSYEKFDEDAMNAAAQHLLGEHDFSAFRSSRCQANHAIRVMQKISVTRQRDYLILDIKANAFLHHMVRNIMGTLMVIGRGEQSIDWMREILVGQDRKCAGMTASPAGLYLVNVEYPKECGLPDSGWLPNIN
ncbi:MAG: tRNA pseudouridine(38-40) synthase TruA, partial [Gammaproteobacteria bacterium]|nr:tRNA pseudouridine(38-40) synthase TruA [Gammaproteobacteria bacterium]